MRKQLIIFLILVFVFGLVPVNFSVAITQNQIDAEVQIVCTDGIGNWFSGSGTMIDPKGIILTNRHVVEGAYLDTCFIGFIESISQEPNFGTEGNYNLAEVKYKTTSDDMDAAILYLDNPTNKTYPYINIWDSNSDALQFGDKVEVIGFPGIGGSTVTYTSGDFSGFGSSADGTQNYIKSTAPLEHGNSGGASYNSSGQFIGIPSMVVAGTLNSMSYVLSVNSIKSWLGGILGNQYQKEVIKQVPAPAEPTVNIQNDITPPDLSKLNTCYGHETDLHCQSYINYGAFDELSGEQLHGDNFDQVWWKRIDGERIVSDRHRNIRLYIDSEALAEIDKESGLYSIYYKYSDNLSTLNNIQEYEFIFNNEGYNFEPITDVLQIPDKENLYYISLRFKDNAGNISDSYVLSYMYLKDHFKNLSNIKFYTDSSYANIIGDYNFDLINSGSNFKYCVTKHKDIYLQWEYNIKYEGAVAKNFSTDMWQLTASDIVNNKDLTVIKNNRYGVRELNNAKENNEYFGTNICENKNDNWCHTTGKVTSFLLKPYLSNEENLYLEGKNIVIKFAYNPDFPHDILCGGPDIGRLNNFNQPYYVLEEGNPLVDNNSNNTTNNNLSNSLSGMILLQVEANGEAYYVYPDDSKRYYLGRPTDAFNAMRKLGLGATHEFITSHTIYPGHVLGKILLDVEKNGEAYYIYPKDKKAYYLGRPADAFRIMRELGLGITNSDLNKIPEGNL